MMIGGKNRHGCLTAFLVLNLVGNIGGGLMYVLLYTLGSSLVHRVLPNVSGMMLPMLFVISLFNLVCTIALFQWQKWGFWGFCGASVVGVIVNLLIGTGIGTALGGLMGMLVLFGVLNIGKENKGWTQLE